MMRRESLLAMGQHLSTIKAIEESEPTESSELSNKNNMVGIGEDEENDLRYRILIEI